MLLLLHGIEKSWKAPLEKIRSEKKEPQGYYDMLRNRAVMHFFIGNIFYKNTEAEICEILRILVKNKLKAEILKRI